MLVQQAAARSSVTAHGNEILDILALSRRQHAVSGCIFWPQPTMQCYSLDYFFKPYNSILLGGDERPRLALIGGVLTSPLPEPEFNLSGSPYGSVTWVRTSGGTNLTTDGNIAKVVLPDGDPIVTEIRVNPGAGVSGAGWSFQTGNLGTSGWDKGYKATKSGQMPKNGAVTVRVRRGQNETPVDSAKPVPPPFPSGGGSLTPAQVLAQANAYVASVQAQNATTSYSSDVRVTFGSVFSVLLPGDGTPPVFMQKSGVAVNGLPIYSILHTFNDVPTSTSSDDMSEYYVTFAPIGGRLAVAVNSKDLATNAFIYASAAPNGHFKAISVAPAPVIVSGVNGGAVVQFGIYHLAWQSFGQVASTMTLTDAQTGINAANYGQNAPFGIVTKPFLNPYCYIPSGGYGILTEARQVSPTALQYRVTLCSSSDNRETSTLKWIKLTTPRLTNPGTSAFTDYGPAVTKYVERQPQPDFDGSGSNRGSNGSVDLTFDIYALGQIDAKNGTNWRTALSKYAPVSFVMGNYLHDETVANSGVTSEEFTRIQGYLAEPKQATSGFQDSVFTVTLHDPYLRLREPSGFVSSERYAPLATIRPDIASIYGHDCIRYILRRTIDDATADGMLVYMPKAWPPHFSEVVNPLFTGNMPVDNNVIGLPPEGKYVDEWMREIASTDFAGLYFAGAVPVYGQYDLIIAGLAVIDVYDGTDSSGNPFYSSSIPDSQLRMVITKAEGHITTKQDYNSVYISGRAPDGTDGTTLEYTGQGLLPALWKDYGDIKATWERTYFVPPTTSQFDSSYNAVLATLVGRFVANSKASSKYSVEMPFTYPTLFWGNKIRIHGATDVAMNGKVLRCLNVVTTGDMVRKKATMSLELVEVV